MLFFLNQSVVDCDTFTSACQRQVPGACNFIKKETLAQVFSCEFCVISKNTFFHEHLWWLPLKRSYACYHIICMTVALRFCEFSHNTFSVRFKSFPEQRRG